MYICIYPLSATVNTSISKAFSHEIKLLAGALDCTLQKQICCFDHRVVTVVAVMLWL